MDHDAGKLKRKSFADEMQGGEGSTKRKSIVGVRNSVQEYRQRLKQSNIKTQIGVAVAKRFCKHGGGFQLKVGNVVDGKYIGDLDEKEQRHERYRQNSKEHESSFDENFAHL